MEFLELARRRQSCRAYQTGKSVPRELIDKCLEAARLAPSACNSQPWSFVVVDREPLKTQLVKESCSGLFSLNKFAAGASAIVVVVTERSRYAARLGGHFRGVQYSLIDIGIACQHFDLQAAELGLGTCWLGWFNEKAVKEVLGLPKSAKVDVIFTLGYPSESSIRTKSRKSLAEIRRYAE